MIANKSVLETRNIPRNKLMFVAARDEHTSVLRRASSQKGIWQGQAHLPNLSFSTPFAIAMDQDIGSQFNTPPHTHTPFFKDWVSCSPG